MKVISLSPSITEIIYALDAADYLIGVTNFCDYPEEAKQKPKVGGWSTANLQKVIDLKPDLVLTSTIVQGKAAEMFRGARFEHYHFDPRSLADIYESIIEIGELAGRKKEAIKLVRTMKEEVDVIAIRRLPEWRSLEIASSSGRISRNDNARRPRVYCEEWPNPPMISGNWVPELVKLAGGEYGIIKPGEISRPFTDEEVIAWDPEIIIMNYCGFGTRPKPETIKKRAAWQNISAVKNDKIYVIDDSLLNRPGPRIVEGLARLARIIRTNE